MESVVTVQEKGSSDRYESAPTTLTAEERALAIAAQAAEEMAAAWRRGERPTADAALAAAPDATAFPNAALLVIREEVRLRRQHGPPPELEDFRQRFPLWADRLDEAFASQSPHLPSGESVLFPTSGETLGDCRLLSELGRGAQGRVFLAAQTSLADRLVVLKMGPRDCHEHLALARLLHAHVVPLLFAQEYPVHNLRVMAMPYLGGASLSQLRDALAAIPVAARTGRDLLEALDRIQGSRPAAGPLTAPARTRLETSTYVEAICWVGACLADALHYAHERCMLHLDLKSSNVLIAGDGQPLLLDFHLARPPLPAGSLPPGWFGGTPGFMSPEQRQALDAVRARRPIPLPLDGRSDVYSLGVVLFEMLGAEPTARSLKAPARVLRRANREVSAGLADIIARCIHPDPARRYPQAGVLAADLRRHLAHQPLVGAPNRSMAERWRKWRRRKPHALAWTAVGLLLLATVAAAAALACAYFNRQRQEAKAALADGEDLLRRGLPAEAERALGRGQEVAAGVPWSADLIQELADRRRQAARARLAQNLHRTADELRFLYDPDGLAPEGRAALEEACGRLWDERDRLIHEPGRENDSEEEQIHTDLRDLAIFWVSLRERTADGHDADARRKNVAVLDAAETLFGSSPALGYERVRCGAAPGADMPPRTAWDHYALGRLLLSDGDLDRAAAALGRAVELQPQGFWPNFFEGACAYRRGLFAEAESAFRVCVALQPECAPCRYNHGLAEAALDQPDRARADYDRSLELDPHYGAAWLNRGALNCHQKRWNEALEDLRRALAEGGEPTAAHYNAALAYDALGEKTLARREVEAVLAVRPDHAGALELLRKLP